MSKTATELSAAVQNTISGSLTSLGKLNQLEQLVQQTHSDTPFMNVIQGYGKAAR